MAFAADEAPPLRNGAVTVGDVSELDLEQLRRSIERVQPATPAAAAPPLVVAVRYLDLEEALRTALESNLSLQIVALDRDEAEREVPATRAFFHPTPGFDYLASGSETVNPAVRDPGTGLIVTPERTASIVTQAAGAFIRQQIPTGATLTLSADVLRQDASGTELRNEGAASVELRQPLMRGGRTYVATRPIRDASYDLDIQEARLQAEILRVSADTQEAYYNTILAARLIEVTEEAVARDRRLIEASQALFRAARATRRDVVSAQIRLSDNLASLALRRADLDRARLELADVLGLPIGEIVQPAESTVPFRTVEFQVDDWVGRALTQRPEILELRTELEKAELDVRVAGNDVLPKLDLVGLYGRGDNDDTLLRAFDFRGDRWEAGLQFEIPFGNVAAREWLSAARIAYRRIERRLTQRERSIEFEVRDEAIRLRENLEDLRAQSTKVEKAREKLEIAVARYRLGIANNLDITDAQTDLLDAETSLLSAVVDYVNGLARLEARIAGPL
jgi:outer membrane protein TolC